MTDIIVKDIKNGSEYYYGGSAEVSAEDVSYDNSSSGAVANNIQDAMDEVFQSVSNGKELIADAITDKGVSTSASDSFQTMATNIGLISSNALDDLLSISTTPLFLHMEGDNMYGTSFVKGNIEGYDVYAITVAKSTNGDVDKSIMLIVDTEGNIRRYDIEGSAYGVNRYGKTLLYNSTTKVVAICYLRIVETGTYGCLGGVNLDTLQQVGYSGSFSGVGLNTVVGYKGITFGAEQYPGRVEHNSPSAYALLYPKETS